MDSCPPHAGNTCAVIVVSEEDPFLPQRLALLSEQAKTVFVVVNGSLRFHQLGLDSLPGARGVFIRNPANLGIAVALNQGLRQACDQDFGWALLLDQDSNPAPDMVLQLSNAYRRVENPERVAIIAPRVINRGLGTEARHLRKAFGPLYTRVPCEGELLEGVTTVITSGSLVNLEAFHELGGFREDFFIDYVDTEYCLRALCHGYRTVVACAARLEHRLGRRTRESIGPLTFYPTHHSPVRWYYMSRNRIPMIRTYGRRFPHWLTYEIVASFYIMLRMLLTENERSEKVRAFFKGTWDGLCGRMGPGPLGSA